MLDHPDPYLLSIIRCGDEVLAMLKCVEVKQWTWHWSCTEQHIALQRCYLECQEQPKWMRKDAYDPVWKSIERAKARLFWVLGFGKSEGS